MNIKLFLRSKSLNMGGGGNSFSICLAMVIWNLILCWYFIKNGGIPTDKISLFCFIMLSIVSGICFYWSWNIVKIVMSIRSWSFILLLIMYTGFAYAGNYLWIFPISKPWNFNCTKVYVVICLWLFPLILLIISVFLKANYHLKCTEKINSRSHVDGNSLVYKIGIPIFTLAGLIYLAAYNPAVTSEDTLTQFRQALGLEPLVDWHTPFHTLMIRLLLSIWNSPTFVVIIQYIFCIWIFLKGLCFINEFHYCDSVLKRKIKLYIITFLLVISPNHILTMITIWKDVPYAFTILWMTILTARLLIYKKKSLNRTFLINCIISLVFVWLLRKNGFVVYVVTALSWLLVSKMNKKMVYSLAISLTLIIVFQFSISGFLNTDEKPIGGQYLGLGHDIVGVYRSGGKLTQQARQIAEFLDSEEYSPYEIYGKANFGLEIPIDQFLSSYIQTFIRNPTLMIKVVLCRMDLAWDIATGNNGMIGAAGYRDTVSHLEQWSQLYPDRNENRLTVVLDKYIDKTVNTSINYMCWRVGLWLILGGCAGLSWVLLKQRILLIILMPFLGQLLSLFLSTSWPDYRYFYPLILSLQFFIGMSIINWGNRSEVLYENR